MQKIDGQTLFRWLSSVFGIFLITACAGQSPVLEYSLARTAINSAKDYEAPRHAQAFWRNAEDTYQEARDQFKERNYKEAKVLFAKARQFAERAETQARLARFKSGEAVP